MKRVAIALFALALGLFVGCPTNGPTDDGSDQGPTRYSLAGSITVAEESYWGDVKLGVFSGGELGTYPSIAVRRNAGVSRLAYSDSDDGSAVELVPIVSAIGFTGTSGTVADYVFDLPAEVPDSDPDALQDEAHHVAVWLDRDDDGYLDVVDSGVIADIESGELNRLPLYETVDDLGATPRQTTITITKLLQSRDELTGKLRGGYKYVGSDDQGFNQILPLDPGVNDGFDFTIDADTGW